MRYRLVIIATLLGIMGIQPIVAHAQEINNDPMCDRIVGDMEWFRRSLDSENLPVASETSSVVIYADERNGVHWIFTKSSHTAHPSVICQQLIRRPGGASFSMSAKCSAQQSVCDAFAKEFEQPVASKGIKQP